MAKVKIEAVMDHLSIEMRKALKLTIDAQFPNARYDERELFRSFRRNVGRKCSTWETVPDGYVEAG